MRIGWQSTGKCKACGEPLIWIATRTGKKMPCNQTLIYYEPDTQGPLRVVRADGTVVAGRPSKAEDAQIGYASHFSTCPAADKFRRGKAK